jgi:SAM-dependent methyltransferase
MWLEPPVRRMLRRRSFELHRGHILPPRDLRRRMCGEAFQSNEFYVLSGVAEARRLVTRLSYTSADLVVDIGCGLGRLATGMLWEFGEAEYLGIDAHREFVEWGQKHIQRDHASFRFLHHDVVHEMYNQGGTLDGASIRLPVASGVADIVYLWGVFTSLPPEHVQIYAAEISRIARPGARVFLTAFVEDDVPEVSLSPADYAPFARRGPLHVVRYSKPYLLSMFERHGLVLEELRYHGGAFPYQSEIYLRRAPLPR